MSPGETIRTAITIALKRNCAVIAIEANGYKASLGYWFNFICQQMGISGIHAVEIYSGKNAKTSRILIMFKQYRAGEILIHPDCRAAVHSQIVAFNPLKTRNVDGLLDCVAYAPKVIELYMDLILSTLIIENQENSELHIYSDYENSPF
jgi:hypothetical protein